MLSQHKMTLFYRDWPTTLQGIWVMLACAICGVALPAAADEEPQDYAQMRLAEAPHPFNGSFAEWSARGGPLIPSSGAGSTGWTADIGFRNSFPMYIGDHRLSYNFGLWELDERSLQMHGLHLALALHPFYLALLSEGLKSHFLASLHLELGLGPRWGRLSGDDNGDGDALNNLGLAATLGSGFDLPITSPNRGRSLWINVLYRRTWSFVRFDVDEASHRLHDHSLFLGLAWRSNGIIW